MRRVGTALADSVRVRVRSPLALGYMAAAGAATAYGVTNVLGKKLVSDFANPVVTATFGILVGILVLSLFVGRRFPTEVRAAPRRALLFISLAGVTSTLGVVLMFAALSKAPVIVVSPGASLSPLIAIGLAHFFLQRLERITRRIVLGTVLVLAGVVTITAGASL